MTLTSRSNGVTKFRHFLPCGTISVTRNNCVRFYLISSIFGAKLAIMKGHNRHVSSCSSDASGKFIVSAGWDSKSKVWDGQTGKFVSEIKGSHCPINCVAFHPEGQLVVVGGWDSTLRIWDILHQTWKAVLRGHKSSIRAVAYSPSGRHIASAALDGEVKMWSAINGSQVASVVGHALPINSLTFSKTGQELITVSDDHKIKVWSGHVGKPMGCLGESEYGPALCVALCKDGEHVAVGYHHGQTRVFDVASGDLVFEVSLHVAAVRCVKYTTDNTKIVTGSDDGIIKVMNRFTGSEQDMYSAFEKPVLCLACAQCFIAAGSEDCSAKLYKTGSRTMWIKDQSINLRKHTGAVTSVAFNPDETKLVTASKDMSLIIWMDLHGTPTPETVMDACHSDWITSCAWSNMADYIVTSSNDFNLKLWDLKTGKEKAKFTGHTSSISAVGYQYGCIVSSCTDGSVKVWSHKGTEITTLYGHSERVNGCDILVKVKKDNVKDISQQEGSMTDWAAEMDATDWKSKHEKTKLEKSVKIEDVMVVSCSDDGTVRLWQPLQANELSCLMGHSDRVISVASTTEGHIVSSSLDKTVKLWKPNFQPSTQVKGHDAEVTAIGYDEGLSFFLTGSRDGSIAIWKTPGHGIKQEQAVCLHRFKAHAGAVNSIEVQYLAHRCYFYTASDDGTIKSWSTSTHGENISGVLETVWNNASSLPVKKVIRACTYVPGKETTTLVWDSGAGQLSYRNKASASVGTVIDSPENWLMDLCLSSDTDIRPIKIYGVTIDGKLISWIVIKGKNPQVSLDNIYEVIRDKSNGRDKKKIKADLNEKPYSLLSVTCVKNEYVYAGDSTGCLVMWIKAENNALKQQSVRKIHAGAVSCIAQFQQYIFTGSHDHSIKVWLLSEGNDQMKQVSHFFCQAPVTSLGTFYSNEKHQVIAGDDLGNVYMIFWT